MFRIFTSIAVLLAVTATQAQSTTEATPKLVIGIAIDQLRGDILQYLKHNLSEKGFKRLMRDGVIYDNIQYDFPVKQSAPSIATVYTGVNPNRHGIVSEKKYNRDKNVTMSIFDDDIFAGRNSTENLSPKSYSAYTISDELKIASKGQAKVYAFAPQPEQAIASAGQGANAAYWIDDISGNWLTSFYYGHFFESIIQDNKEGFYSSHLSRLSWTPLLSKEKYNALPYTTTSSSFQHQFSGVTAYQDFKTSALVNECVRKSAVKLLRNASLGKGKSADFLTITFYAGNYAKTADKDYSMELQDTYLRLDADIAAILEEADKAVGLKNTLVFVFSTGYFNSDCKIPKDVNVKESKFYYNRCKTLLNMYLMATYGQKEWIDCVYDNQIFFNRKLIENSGLDISLMRKQAAEFLLQFEGICRVITYSQMQESNSNPNLMQYPNLFNADFTGDVLFELYPGTVIVEESQNKTSENSDYKISAQCPAFFFGYNLKPQIINRTISAVSIAPSVCRILRIRPPNSTASEVLYELFE